MVKENDEGIIMVVSGSNDIKNENSTKISNDKNGDNVLALLSSSILSNNPISTLRSWTTVKNNNEDNNVGI